MLPQPTFFLYFLETFKVYCCQIRGKNNKQASLFFVKEIVVGSLEKHTTYQNMTHLRMGASTLSSMGDFRQREEKGFYCMEKKKKLGKPVYTMISMN